ncbi:AraC family transcriptional regulator [Hominenteromicrobium sp.]|uniref:AraC family transcriptional regulator n=1 Tax=Hominenteromicrobium sp. TaxID=3073581 RepID=UPI003AB6F71C
MPVNRAKFHFDNTYAGMDMLYGPYVLYQIGDLSCEAGYQTFEHEQAVYEITYVLSGTGAFYVDDTVYTMQKGDLLLVRKGQMHNIISAEIEPLRFFYLGFDFVEPIVNEKIAQLKSFFDTNEQVQFHNAVSLQDTFMRVLSEFISDDVLSNLLIEAYMQEIICGVYRIFSRKFYKNYLLSGSNNSDEKLVYDVINYIDVHLESMENLSALSAEFGYSYTHIAQKFSAFTGESLKSYHTKRRFEKSNEYLRQGYSVTKVAELMGFKLIHAFSRAYKKYVGMAPREYKKWAEEDKKNLPQPAENS